MACLNAVSAARGSPFARLQGAQARIADALRRVVLDGLFDLGDGAVHVLQSGERVAFQHLRFNAIRRRASARARHVPFASSNWPASRQQLASLELRVHILGHQVRRPNLLAERALGVLVLQIRVGQLRPRLTGSGVRLHREPVFQDGFSAFLPWLAIPASPRCRCEVYAAAGSWRHPSDSPVPAATTT